MRFAFDEEQLLFQSTVRELLEKECGPAHVRAMWSDPAGRSPELWLRLAEVGVVGLTVPEAHGGLGRSEVDLVLLLEEAGRAALPEPVAETTAVAVPLLRDAAPPEVQARWLPKIASGRAIATVGLESEPHVADAHVADLLLIQNGDELHAVPTANVQLTPRTSLDRARRLFDVTWEPSSATRVDADPAHFDAAFDRGVLAAAAQLVGVGDRLISLAATYATERHQFGRPIGSFQAVKHLLADALLRVEFARPVVYRAAWSVAHDVPDRGRDVSMAKAYASEAATSAARAALQVHGAIGYTWEHDLHLWMKRAWALAAAWGDAEWHVCRVGRSAK